MYRVLFQVFRHPSLTYEEFLNHYRNNHVPIAKRFPALRSYEIFPADPQDNPEHSDGPDAFAVMTFDSPEDFQTVLASQEFAEAVADNESFVDRFGTFVVGHIPVR